MKGKTIYYRGFLKSCNYRCSYCPFSKKPDSPRQIEKDREALERFCGRTELFTDTGIMLLPYGEALIHPYYHEQMERLVRRDHVRFLACQTNLSFDIDTTLSRYTNPGKLKLWCSFHPSQTTVEDFISQCRKLKRYGIPFSVGAVGDPEMLPVIQRLRRQLDPDVYLWINDMDGRRRAYTGEETEAFAKLDPLFVLEQKKLPADIMKCRGGQDSVFVNGKGEMYACNISKIPLGNIYQEEPASMDQRACRSKTCSCYLAYSNRLDLEELKVFGAGYAYRIPDSGSWKSGIGSVPAGIRAMFFDVDGTLTNPDGVVPGDIRAAVQGLAGISRLYLATSLPYRDARRKCREIWDCLDGGAFAEGSDIRIFSTGYDETIPLRDYCPEGDFGRTRRYRKNGVLHKVTVMASVTWPDVKGYHVVYEDGRTGVTDRNASKLNAVVRICREMGYAEDEVAVFGNSGNDIELLKYFKHSYAVENSSREVKDAAGQVCDIVQLIQAKPAGNGV